MTEIVDKYLYGSEVELVDDVDLPKEEPVSDFTKALAECINQAQCAVVDPMAHAEIWKGELLELAKGKEPVSEDLEKAAKECAFNLQLQEYFKKGAQWKEKQMKEKCSKLIQISFDNGVETGRNEMKRDAKEAHVIMTHVTKDSVVPSLSAVTLDDSYKEGDKVKVLILKE